MYTSHIGSRILLAQLKHGILFTLNDLSSFGGTAAQALLMVGLSVDCGVLINLVI